MDAARARASAYRPVPNVIRVRSCGNKTRSSAVASVVMSWLEWIILVAAIVGIFVLWDLVFCGGEHCKQLIGRE